MPLTALQVKNAKPGRHSDGKGLYLLVKPSGARSWVLRVQVDGIRRDFGIGSVDVSSRAAHDEVPLGKRKILTLAEAREKAAEGRRLAKAGLDPAIEWRRSTVVIPSFERAARDYHETVKASWRNGKHGDQWLATLEAHAFPTIGATRVDEIDAPTIQSVLLPIWLALPETARRVRQRIGSVLDYAHGQGWRSAETPRGAVNSLMKRIKQPRRGPGFAAMPYAELPALMEKLRDEEGTTGRLALMFTILTAARSGEVRGAIWPEIDLEGALWTVPAERMKGGEEHKVPLPEAAVEILRAAKELVGAKDAGPVFPAMKGRPMSDATLAKVLRVAGSGAYTVHGMRSAFRDWVAEQTAFPGDWAEAALAHTLPNKVEAAYKRTKFIEQRRKLMAAWAGFLAGNPSANVVSMHERSRRGGAATQPAG